MMNLFSPKHFSRFLLVMLYVRTGAEEVFDALMLSTPTLSGLQEAVSIIWLKLTWNTLLDTQTHAHIALAVCFPSSLPSLFQLEMSH